MRVAHAMRRSPTVRGLLLRLLLILALLLALC